MPYKLLTAIEQVFGTLEQTVILVKGAMVEATLELRRWETVGKMVSQYHTYRHLDVQRLMTYLKAIRYVKLLPLLTPKETLPHIHAGMLPTFEEELMFLKHLAPLYKLEQERILRQERLRTEQRTEQTRLTQLHQQSITLTDQRAFASLETYLHTFQLEWYEKILLKIIDMCRRKQLYLERIIGKEHLEKLMLQMYVCMFMGTPAQVNMLALRVTQATMPHINGMSGTLYAQVVSQGQAVKCAMLQQAVQKRKQETKRVAQRKPLTEYFPVRIEGGYVKSVNKEGEISISKDLSGKGFALLVLMFAFSIPYFIKRFIAQSWGFPQNYKLLRRPFISFMPFRITLARKINYRYPESAFTFRQRDSYILKHGLWRTIHGEHYLYRPSHGAWRRRRYIR